MSADGCSQRTEFQPMCGSFRPRGSSRTTRAGQQPEAGRALVLVGAIEEQLHAEAQADDRHAGLARARTTSSRPSARRRRIASGNAPTPGTTSPSAARSSPGSEVCAIGVPTCSKALATERRLPIP